MPEEENKILRDLISETLQTKGILGRIQAEIRASVFLALEEQDVFKDKSPFINKQLKEFLKSSDGITIISLIREFLEFFNLEFSSMVFDPETHAGLDYNYEGRSKLANRLHINDNDKHQPLLSQILKLTKSYINNQSEKNELITKENISGVSKLTAEINDNPCFDELNGSVSGSSRITSRGNQDKFSLQDSNKQSFLEFNYKTEERLNERMTKETGAGASLLTSLSNLPPLGKSIQTNTPEQYDLKTLLDLSPDRQYEDDFLSSESDHVKKGSKIETGSEDSEVEQEISGITNISQQDNLTADISISRSSGHGDYLENL